MSDCGTTLSALRTVALRHIYLIIISILPTNTVHKTWFARKTIVLKIKFDFCTFLHRKGTFQRREPSPDLNESLVVPVDTSDGLSPPLRRQNRADLPQCARPVHLRRHHVQLVLQNRRYPGSNLDNCFKFYRIIYQLRELHYSICLF